MKKLLFIYNPTTGGGRLKNRLYDILLRFSAAGYELRVWPTHARGDARKIAKKYGGSADLMVCCGGDGTLNEVVDGMMTLENRPQLGYIPGGTTCDFAQNLLLPKSNMLAAADRILNPKKLYQCDVGILNGRAFTYVAAFGAFTDVAYRTPQKYKNALGHLAYIVEGVQQLPGLQPCHARIECDEGVFEDDYLLGMVANSATVAGFSLLDKRNVHMDDGVFEVLLVKYPQNLSELGELSAALLRGNVASPLLKMLCITNAKFTYEHEVPFTLDGEYGGTHKEVEVQVAHKAMSICI